MCSLHQESDHNNNVLFSQGQEAKLGPDTVADAVYFHRVRQNDLSPVVDDANLKLSLPPTYLVVDSRVKLSAALRMLWRARAPVVLEGGACSGKTGLAAALLAAISRNYRTAS